MLSPGIGRGYNWGSNFNIGICREKSLKYLFEIQLARNAVTCVEAFPCSVDFRLNKS